MYNQKAPRFEFNKNCRSGRSCEAPKREHDPLVGRPSPQVHFTESSACGRAFFFLTVFGAASPLLEGIGGVYLKDNDVSEIDDTDYPLSGTSIPSMANSAMFDADDARRLWDLSEQLTA